MAGPAVRIDGSVARDRPRGMESGQRSRGPHGVAVSKARIGIASVVGLGGGSSGCDLWKSTAELQIVPRSREEAGKRKSGGRMRATG